MIPTIPNLIFALLLAIGTGYLTFLTTKGGLTDNRHSKLWRRLTKRGKIVLAVLFGIASILTLQEINLQVKNDRTEMKMTQYK